MKFNFFNFAIGLALLVALLLGGLIIVKSGILDKKPQVNTQQGLQSTTRILSADEAKALNVPSNAASPQEKEAHLKLLTNLAQAAGSLDITGCVPTPLVFKVRNDSEIIVTNKDSVEHVIILDQGKTYTIPAKGQVSVKVIYSKVPGIHGIGCDSFNKAVGFFAVSEQ
jgi:hypothetical protein